MPTRAVLLVAAGVAVLVVLFLVLRPDEDTSAEPPRLEPAQTELVETEPEPTVAQPQPEAPVTEPEDDDEDGEESPPPAAPGEEVVSIRVREGRVEGGVARPTFRRGDRIRLVVRSDVADHVHVHGYDIMRDVAPGQPAQISFQATLTGRFEVELEDRRLHIAELEVRP